MSTSREFVEYVCDQLSGAGEITARIMFGEYGLYCNGKIIGLICGGQLYIKPTDAGHAILPNAEMAPPYNGAKPYILLDSIDDRDLMKVFISATYLALPDAKSKNV